MKFNRTIIKSPAASQRIVCLVSLLTFALTCFFPTGPAFPYWVWSRETGKFINPEHAVEGTAEKQMEYALGFYEKKDFEHAEDELRKLVKFYPGAKVAPEAQYKLGLLYEEQGDFYKAFRAYRKLLEYYPQSPRTGDVLERLYRIGNAFLSGKRAKLMGFPILPALPRAIEVFDLMVKSAPFHEYGPKAMFQLGVAYRRSRNYAQSLAAFQNLIDTYPESPLVADAKFQLAEVSFEMSASTLKDEESLKEAENYFEEFLGEYPDTSVRKKAVHLKKEIDDLNAKKYFEIGRYYENENHLQSATIYYEDVVKNYPKSTWAAKAREKLAMFRRPADYVRGQEERFAEKLVQIEEGLNELHEQWARLPKDREGERAVLAEKISALEKRDGEVSSELRSFHRRKMSDIKRQQESLRQRQQELKKKYKTLEQKKKLLKKNPSEDLRKALSSWFDSLRSEQWALAQEKADLVKLERNLGIHPGKNLERWIPFLRETPVSEIAAAHERDLTKIAETKRAWDLKKDELYEVLDRILLHLGEMTSADIRLFSDKDRFERSIRSGRRELKQRRAKLVGERRAIEQIRALYEEKREVFQKEFGQSAGIFSKPKALLTGTWHLLTFSSGSLEEEWKRLVQERGRLLSELEEKRAQIETIRTAFEDELKGKKAPVVKPDKTALKKKVKERVRAMPVVDRKELKKKIKALEKEIRWRYEEIEDRNEVKKRKLTDLTEEIGKFKKRESVATKAARAFSSPFTGTGRFFRAFLFGLKGQGRVAREEAARLKPSARTEAEYERVKKTEGELEFESLMIEARAKEIGKLKAELAPLKEQAEKTEGFSYRSLFVEKPGGFLSAILMTTGEIIPFRRRKKLLIDRLDGETRGFQELAGKLEWVNLKIQQLDAEIKSLSTKPIDDEKLGAQKEAEYELESLRSELEKRQAAYKGGIAKLEAVSEGLGRDPYAVELKEHLDMTEGQIRDKKKFFEKERVKTEGQILEIVQEQSKILKKEGRLVKRKVVTMEKEIDGLKKKADSQYTLLEGKKKELTERLKGIDVEREGLQRESLRLLESLQSKTVRVED